LKYSAVAGWVTENVPWGAATSTADAADEESVFASWHVSERLRRALHRLCEQMPPGTVRSMELFTSEILIPRLQRRIATSRIGREVLRSLQVRVKMTAARSPVQLIDGGAGDTRAATAGHSRPIMWSNTITRAGLRSTGERMRRIASPRGGSICISGLRQPPPRTDDRPRLAGLKNREIGGGQSANRLAILVEHRDVERDDVNARTEGGLGEPKRSGSQEEEAQLEQSQVLTVFLKYHGSTSCGGPADFPSTLVVAKQ
jgi:hypothetical protein